MPGKKTTGIAIVLNNLYKRVSVRELPVNEIYYYTPGIYDAVEKTIFSSWCCYFSVRGNGLWPLSLGVTAQPVTHAEQQGLLHQNPTTTMQLPWHEEEVVPKPEHLPLRRWMSSRTQTHQDEEA